jgi:MFS family permease
MRGPLPRLSELVAICAEFPEALETKQGQQVAARVCMITTQVNLLAQDLNTAETSRTHPAACCGRTARPSPATCRPEPCMSSIPPAARPPAGRHRQPGRAGKTARPAALHSGRARSPTERHPPPLTLRYPPRVLPAASSPCSYRAVLRSRHVARLLAGTLIGRMPCGMVPLAILLLVQAREAPLALGGLLCAVYGLAYALSQPLLGRMVDRRGQTRVLATATAVTTTALLALPLTDPTAQPLQMAALVLIAGISNPPLEPGLRALWPSVLPDPAPRRTALTLDTSTQGLVYILGPPLTAALHAAVGPQLMLAAVAALGASGTLVVLTATPSRTWLPAPRQHDPAGPLRSRGLRLLFTALAGVGIAIGALNVLAVGSAERHEAEWLAGTLPAALPAGTLLGGLLYACRAWPGSNAAHLVAGTAGFAIGWLPLLSDPGPTAAALLVTVPGAFLAPLLTSSFHAVHTLAPPGTATEASAWLIASIGIGQAAGTALTGLVAHAGSTAIAALPAAGAAAAFALLHSGRRRLST